ncbi:MAG: DUF4956 domain-containing protein [Bacillales bacterium]|nr:DUF4956 domain-containing protein [Bacillales bacterium]
MDKLFQSIFSGGIDVLSFLLCMLVSLLTGFILAFMSYFNSKSSKSFYVTTALIPSAVAMVIALVNGNIGVGVAVAGAFALVRFRSSQGSAREICIIFIAMASGLAFGIGYLAYGVLFALIIGSMLMIFQRLPIWDKNSSSKEKILKITIPEDLNYSEVFDEVLKKYTKKYELAKVKSTNLGSMFKLQYNIVLKDVKKEKEFLDEIRCRNGNLEVSLEILDFQNNL